MSKFDQYFLMSEHDVKHYVMEKINYFNDDSVLICKEIGDGNLNYVFRVVDKNSSKSIIVKQAGNTARISDEFKLSTNRIRIESDILKMQGTLAPGLVPKVYLFDETMSCCVMEDLSDHTILRTALLDHKVFPQLAEDISTYMVNTLFLTTDVVLDHKKKKALVERFMNPELCEISEDLVYTEPFNDINNRNELFPLNADWIKKEIYEDKKLHLEVAKLKFEFMTNAQALIHGDLHTGSLFVKENSTKVIDPEFAFYGPIGYDVGNVIANLIFAWANGEANKKEEFIAWVEQTIVDTIDLFKEKLLISWEKNAQDVMAKVPGFNTWYLESILKDTSAVAGLELTRRIIGLAKVKDITSIENKELRARAEKICLTVAKKYILERDTFIDGNSFLKVLKEVQKNLN